MEGLNVALREFSPDVGTTMLPGSEKPQRVVRAWLRVTFAGEWAE